MNRNSSSASTPSSSTHSTVPSANSKCMRSNAAGARTNVAWEYGMDLGCRKVKCNFCMEECTGGVFRFKHHLARTHQNVLAYTKVPEDVKMKIPRGTIFLASIDTSEISKTKEKVFAMLDDFVEKIGEEHVVQVVTDNAANYKAAGEMLMDKRKKLFWTPCVAHCIDLMLEDFEKKIEEHKVTIAKGRKVVSFIYNRTRLICLLKEFSNGKELLRPGATRFATSYLTLCRLYELKDSPAMGFILDAMVNAKKEIKSMYKDVQSRYQPMQHNSKDCGFSKSTFYKCLETMCDDENLSKKIDLQLVSFKKSKGLFNCSTARLTRKEKSPTDWWDSFGDDIPELKQFAIRVLSLTCSSSGCERNWSDFEMVHSKRRNRLQQQKMNDLVFVMYNLKLIGREERKQKEEDFYFEDVDSDDEWIMEDNEDLTTCMRMSRQHMVIAEMMIFLKML
ncbi:SCAN domain-containing protein [Tanacetum coccineum]